MKKFLSVLLALLCTTISVFAFGVDETMSKVMDSWKGCHIDQVIDRWGYPTDEREAVRDQEAIDKARERLYLQNKQKIQNSLL